LRAASAARNNAVRSIRSPTREPRAAFGLAGLIRPGNHPDEASDRATVLEASRMSQATSDRGCDALAEAVGCEKYDHAPEPC
jgi:hypothetical protein